MDIPRSFHSDRSSLADAWPLDPAVLMLNHGSFGACPRPVLEHQARLRQQMEAEPVRFLVRQLSQQGVDTLVDGAHAPGMLPLDLNRLGAAYYVGNIHKWLCAPKGAGFLHVRPDRQEGIQPPVISHGYNQSRAGHTHFQDAFDWQGTDDPTAWLCVGEAIRFLNELLPGELEELMELNHKLAAAARRMLCERLPLRPVCPETMLGSIAATPPTTADRLCHRAD